MPAESALYAPDDNVADTAGRARTGRSRLMAATLTVIWWRDIPAQVIAKDRREAHKVVLHPRFQVAIDRAAMKAGKKSASDYIELWRREQRACGDDLRAEAQAEAERLENAYPKAVLSKLIAAGGLATDGVTA
jgi:cvfA/B/C family virulence factor